LFHRCGKLVCEWERLMCNSIQLWLCGLYEKICVLVVLWLRSTYRTLPTIRKNLLIFTSENLPKLFQSGQRRKSTKFLLPHSHCWLWSSEDQAKKTAIQFLLLPTGAVLRALWRSGQDQGPDAVTQGMFSIPLLANDSFCSFAYLFCIRRGRIFPDDFSPPYSFFVWFL
jgi:hypothetical protein